ncbi:MAG TPA: TlpA disulfide reductase family protein [Bryobacteraceae bacterium]|nr:TlpA disulfide reductase family protein [Bryobacteraceae bacterium]
MWRRRQPKILGPGEPAPGFVLKSLAGGQVSLAQTLAEGPALLAFFKVGCPVCQMTFPFLERMAHNKAVQVIGISQDETGHTQQFNQRFGVTFQTLLDASADGYPASNAYGISSVPTLFLVERDGSISKSSEGFCKRDLEQLGERMGVKPFRADEKVPELKPG